jgi:spore coat protein U-like protein
MKFFRIQTTVAAIALAAASFGASAGQQTSTFNVTASVVPKCTVTSPTNMAFGTYVQESGPVTSSTTIDVTCPNTTPYNVGLSGLVGAVRNMSNGTDILEYNLCSDNTYTTLWGATIGTDTVAGTGTGVVQPISIYGRVPDNAANRLVPAGNYQSVITVTVSY